ncbi:helix-turn-helix domain-containing protein [Candidatus Omnitrophota bacterium]
MQRRYLGIKELSEYLGVKTRTVYSWISEQKIPYVKVGRLVRFELRKIDEWLDNNSVEPRKRY